MKFCLMRYARAAALALVAGAVLAPQSSAQELAPLPEGVRAEASYVSYGTPINMEQARAAVEAALAEATAREWPVAIAVVSPSGDLVYFAMMEDTQLIAPDIAIGKARTAAMFRRPTAVFSESMQNNAIASTLHPTLVASPGGVPIVVDGKIIGAIGVSGAAGPDDARVAQAGIDAVK